MRGARSSRARLLLAAGLLSALAVAMASPLILDDRQQEGLLTNRGTRWRLLSDQVMGGVSSGELTTTTLGDRPCLLLRGRVSLENNGGFLQAGLDLSPDGTLDASAYEGVELEVRGNGETYNLHLRTADTQIVWQSYRASFRAGPSWERVRLPFADFAPYRIERPLDRSSLRRLGLVAIGRAMEAELCLARIALY